MKIALLGTGFGQAHAAIYAERDVEVVVFGRTRARLEDVQQKFGFSTTADLDGLYEDPDRSRALRNFRCMARPKHRWRIPDCPSSTRRRAHVVLSGWSIHPGVLNSDWSKSTKVTQIGSPCLQTRCKHPGHHQASQDGTRQHEEALCPGLDSTRRHQVTPGNTTVPELQNRCAGESWQAGSIPVRLRYLHA
jgi:hypothetical protein